MEIPVYVVTSQLEREILLRLRHRRERNGDIKMLSEVIPGKKRPAYRVLVGKPAGRKLLGRPRLRRGYNIKMEF
jgi:hypothetical protein